MTLKDMYEDGEQPKRPFIEKRAARYLSGSDSVKDDLQEVYELLKEIGYISFQTHTLMGSLSQTMESATLNGCGNRTVIRNIQEEQQELQQEAERIGQIGDVVKEKTEQLLEYAETNAELLGRITESWKAITVAIGASLEANGYDPQTLARRDIETARILRAQEKRREMWLHAIISTFVGVVSTIGLWAYSKSLASNQVETNQAIVEVLKLLKKEAPEHNPNDHTHLGNK